jgi:Putative Ig domain
MSFGAYRESVIRMNLSFQAKREICSLSVFRYTPTVGQKFQKSSVFLSIAAFFFLIPGALAQVPGSTAATLTIASQALPTAAPRQQYEATLQATGGVPPYHWEISSGELPQGLDLNPTTGLISGIPAERGQFEFVVTVSDSADPPHTATRNFAIGSVEALSLEWSNEPHIEQDKILGAVKVANGTKEPFDQTVIIMAVNEYGKAFALGYQRLELKPDNVKVEIPFSSALPRGRYTIHADAVAEIPTKHAIYRNRLETPEPLVITFPP